METQSIEELPQLPEGWVWTRVGEILTFEYGKGLRKDKRDPKGRIPVYGSNGIVGYHSVSLVEKPCLIVGRKGAVGAVHLSKVPCWGIDTTYFVTAPEGLNLSFLFYLLSNLNLHSLDKSTAIPGLNRNDAYAIRIPLAPFPEQQRIVAKIEELFAKLDAGVDSLRKVKAQLKRYRQTVLKDAFEGKLSEEWRETYKGKIEPASVLLGRIKEERKKNEKGKYKELPPVDTSNLPELPESWIWTRLGEIAEVNPKLQKDDISYDMKVSFLPMKAVEERTGKFDLSIIKKYSEVRKGYTPFADGDIIFAKITPCMENGKIAIVNNLKNGIGFGSTEFHVVRLIEDNFSKEYVFLYLLQEHFRREAQRYMKGTAGQLRVPKRFMEEALIPLPPISEQQQIVGEIEHYFSVTDKVEKVAGQSLMQSERLRQSILKNAFEGRLVPHDPTDEPAEKLLERIREEKEYKSQKNIKKKSKREKRRKQVELVRYVK